METTLNIPATSTQEIQRLFNLQQQHQSNIAGTSAKERIAKLNRLLSAIMRYRPAIKAAMYADFKKPPFEVDGVEIYPVTGAIKHTRRHLRRWMNPQKVPTTLAFAGSTSWIQYQSKGVCLIISPWNFPFNLTFVPLVSAIAAGNCAILKPSESTPHSSALIKKIVSEVFRENEVAVVLGAVKESQDLLALPFNHIFFTGSPQVGKIVMAAAAQHLASVTLELGGKSPTIIDETADIAIAVQRLVRGKFANAGQICIAPDYVFVHEKVKDKFLETLKKGIQAAYGDEPKASASLARMVNKKQFERVKACLENAVGNGARVAIGGAMEENDRYIEPTVLTEVDFNSDVMQEEIFGPLLPVHTFNQLQEPIDFINAGERPLTLSIFSKNKKNIARVLQETRAGGTCINHAQLHFYNHDLPFGGINHSGIGHSHGWYGFKEFSHTRSVYRQNFWGPSEALKAPYTKWTEWLMDFTIRWL